MEQLPDMDADLPPITYAQQKPLLNLQLEEQILQNSEYLLPLENRKAAEGNLKFSPLCKFELFYDYDFSKPRNVKPKTTTTKKSGEEKQGGKKNEKVETETRSVDEVKKKIKDQFLDYLKLLGMTGENITVDNKDKLALKIDQNLAIINCGIKLFQILNLQIQKQAGNFSKALFNGEMVSVSQNQFDGTTEYKIASDQFLSTLGV